MAKAHSPAFLALVESIKPGITEIPAAALAAARAAAPGSALIDVREDNEYTAGHVVGAEHIGRGVLERDIEKLHPDKAQKLFLYCGGGFRSALASDNLQKMGYTNVVSVDGGWTALKELLPTE
jgi:rhodanese-related sulfurtransferase